MIDISIMLLETIDFIVNQDEKEFNVLLLKWHPHLDHRLFLGLVQTRNFETVEALYEQQRLLKISLIYDSFDIFNEINEMILFFYFIDLHYCTIAKVINYCLQINSYMYYKFL